MKHIHHSPNTTKMFEYDEYKADWHTNVGSWIAALVLCILAAVGIGALSALV